MSSFRTSDNDPAWSADVFVYKRPPAGHKVMSSEGVSILHVLQKSPSFSLRRERCGRNCGCALFVLKMSRGGGLCDFLCRGWEETEFSQTCLEVRVHGFMFTFRPIEFGFYKNTVTSRLPPRNYRTAEGRWQPFKDSAARGNGVFSLAGASVGTYSPGSRGSKCCGRNFVH